MNAHDLGFVIPTYRLRDIGEAVQHYDQHFWKNGHAFDSDGTVTGEDAPPHMMATPSDVHIVVILVTVPWNRLGRM